MFFMADERCNQFGRAGGQEALTGVAAMEDLSGRGADFQGANRLDLVGRGGLGLGGAVIPEMKLGRRRFRPAKQPQPEGQGEEDGGSGDFTGWARSVGEHFSLAPGRRLSGWQDRRCGGLFRGRESTWRWLRA